MMASDRSPSESPPFTVVPYGADRSQYVEVWPTDEAPIGTAVLIHGGYWRNRYGLDLMHPMARHLVDSGWRVVNIEYRRLAETDSGIWDELSADVLAALAADPDPIKPVVAIGHSAGGQLALWAAARSLEPTNGRAGISADIDAVVALAPVADLVEADRLSLSDGAVRLLLGTDSETGPDLYRQASPRALVPLGVAQLVVHGSADDSVPRHISLDYVAAACAAGDPVELVDPDGVDHFHIIDPAHAVWRTIDRWLQSIAA